jgi:hypothetical protein
VEAKLLQTAASLRTRFVLVFFAETLESLVAFLGYSRARDAKVSTKIIRSMRVFRGQWALTVVDFRLHVVGASADSMADVSRLYSMALNFGRPFFFVQVLYPTGLSVIAMAALVWIGPRLVLVVGGANVLLAPVATSRCCMHLGRWLCCVHLRYYRGRYRVAWALSSIPLFRG